MQNSLHAFMPKTDDEKQKINYYTSKSNSLN